ncbi:acetolactate synthase-1/2/3 large subunit [Raoultella sp. BIGb0149]|uniref:thiamine pyrophosphate-binding protein n=1 Tax=Raoultella sp. BIGb0149 TaxID=2485116 RepID=UPI00105E1DBD|nr:MULTISPECIES: thiamine pyrophosphate-binding protein [Raoultella]TDQ20773.1 acetolactate synthase-1/2/3 large subunit [Raoultella sp. BIGb0149]
MSEMITVGEAIARTLEQYNVEAIYGVISIHNLPIADAVGQRGKIRFVPARGEAGSVTMADAHGRFSGLGVALTSTGAGAGNAVGALVEAMNACTPLLHLTGQVEKTWLDADTGFIHETRDQLTFLKASSKRAYRISNANQALAILHKAIQEAQTPPCGPVSVEIPIDIQGAKIPASLVTAALKAAPAAKADSATVDALWAQLRQAKRPLLWLGGGAIGSAAAVKKLADAGMTVISSTHGRGVLPDAHRASLRAFHNSPSVEALMAQCDFTLVAGSRLRSNETRSWTLELPSPRVQIDIDPAAASRNYLMDNTLIADCTSLLAALAEKAQGREWGNVQWDAQVKEAVALADSGLREQCGAYAQLNDAIAQALPDDGILVRDITVSGSLWGSRLFRAHGPLMNIHSLAGAIGMGLPMAIGTAIANPQRKVVGLVGDGGLSLNLGELATLAQEKANVTLIVMNDGGYGVMRGIQDKYFGGRQYYNELHTPDFTLLAQAIGLQAWSVERAEDFQSVMTEALAMPGPSVVEVKMGQIGALRFAGPPQKTLY